MKERGRRGSMSIAQGMGLEHAASKPWEQDPACLLASADGRHWKGTGRPQGSPDFV